jgi:hypothetical protein
VLGLREQVVEGFEFARWLHQDSVSRRGGQGKPDSERCGLWWRRSRAQFLSGN